MRPVRDLAKIFVLEKPNLVSLLDFQENKHKIFLSVFDFLDIKISSNYFRRLDQIS